MSDNDDMTMDETNDIVVFEDDDGTQYEMEIVDYFPYKGEEYVILAEVFDCTCGAKEGEECTCEDEEVDVCVMKVVPVDEENEDFVPIDPAMEEEVLAFAQKFLNESIPEDEE